jgi:acetyltransferase-like isoleucine patch superfamily enzyme
MITVRRSHRAISSAPSSSPRRSSLLRRVRRIAEDETAQLSVALWLTLELMSLLPSYTFPRLRMRLLRLVGTNVGRRTVFCGRISISGSRNAQRRLTIGTDCMINEGCRFDAGAPITIGDNVHFGQDVAILTTTHAIGARHERCGPHRREPVTVGDGTWVGARVLILPGVTVGAGCVIAAGAVVTRSVADDSLVGGVPARVLRKLD